MEQSIARWSASRRDGAALFGIQRVVIPQQVRQSENRVHRRCESRATCWTSDWPAKPRARPRARRRGWRAPSPCAPVMSRVRRRRIARRSLDQPDRDQALGRLCRPSLALKVVSRLRTHRRGSSIFFSCETLPTAPAHSVRPGYRRSCRPPRFAVPVRCSNSGVDLEVDAVASTLDGRNVEAGVENLAQRRFRVRRRIVRPPVHSATSALRHTRGDQLLDLLAATLVVHSFVDEHHLKPICDLSTINLATDTAIVAARNQQARCKSLESTAPINKQS